MTWLDEVDCSEVTEVLLPSSRRLACPRKSVRAIRFRLRSTAGPRYPE
jgi:hypothetical protein